MDGMEWNGEKMKKKLNFFVLKDVLRLYERSSLKYTFFYFSIYEQQFYSTYIFNILNQ